MCPMNSGDTKRFLGRLADLLPGRVMLGEKISRDYSRDETPGGISVMPLAVTMPHTEEEISEIMRLCREENVPVTVRGAGTGLVGGAVPAEDGIVLCTAEMTGIQFDEKNMMVRVQCGVTLEKLQTECERRDLFYPPDPGKKSSTIGGNAATNAGGMRAVKYGVTRDYILGLRAVLADGEIVRLGGTSDKNSSGYNLLHLILGSEGTLGIITELTIRLLPLPIASVSLLAMFPDESSALHAVSDIRKRFLPCSLEFADGATVRAAQKRLGETVYPEAVDGTEVEAYLLIRLDGDSASALSERCEELGGLMLDFGALDVLLADLPSEGKKLFTIRDGFLNATKLPGLPIEELDASLPMTEQADYLAYVRELGERNNLSVTAFGHAGSGNLHIYLFRECEESVFAERVRPVLKAAYKYIADHGGVLSGEHGLGNVKDAYIPLFFNETERQLMQTVKTALDPKNILNPGKLGLSHRA